MSEGSPSPADAPAPDAVASPPAPGGAPLAPGRRLLAPGGPFRNRSGELRSGFRVLAFVLLLGLALSAVSLATGGVVARRARVFRGDPAEVVADPAAFLAVFSLLTLARLAAALVATAAAARLLERRTLASVGLLRHRGWSRDLAAGLAIGAAVILATAAVEGAGGALRVTSGTERGVELALFGVGLALVILLAGATEEVVLRGFPFQALVHDLGPGAALAITSLLFGLLHAGNPSASAFSLANTTLAGLFLGVAYLRTRSLWLAIGIHGAWNFTMAFVLGLPVSGFAAVAALHLWRGESGEPGWLSGGAYGPEGGAATTAVVLLATALLWRSRAFAPAPETLAALRHGSADLSRDAPAAAAAPAAPPP